MGSPAEAGWRRGDWLDAIRLGLTVTIQCLGRSWGGPADSCPASDIC